VLRVVALLLAILAPAVAAAVEPSEVLKDPVLEARARAISTGLRCLVCQNQSIDDSNAPLAADLRVLIRERLSAGDSDEQAIHYLVARYGEFILLRPEFNAHTALLWLAPPVVLLLGVGLAVAIYRRRSTPVAPLTTSEQAALDRALSDRS
jgi:cytochrome c-type biogenesis protein CcmH